MLFRRIVFLVETYFEFRRDRRLLNTMSWRDLADIGVEVL